MMDPKVSVVMAVYNGGRYVASSIESVCRQEGVAFEFVIVDDGSTDDSPAVLERYAASDSRVRLVRQGHSGLTAALVRGCDEARGEYIARQDADDLSLPGRLQLQARHLNDHPSVVLVGCWTRFIGPEGEELLLVKRGETPEEATSQLRSSTLERLRGLGGHGSAMFRRRDYLRAGGYRLQFYFAQDLDLWLRLTDRGHLAFVPAVLYAPRLEPLSITGRFRQAQVALARLAMDMARVRDRGGDETPLLREASTIRPGGVRGARPRDESAGLYFIGKCLLDRGDARCVPYLKGSLRKRPLHFRAWRALGIALLRRNWAPTAPGAGTD